MSAFNLHLFTATYLHSQLLQTSAVHFSQKFLKVLHGTEDRVDVLEILHVVAEVLHGRAEDGPDPHRLDV